MITYPDGSIILLPGEPLPDGYVQTGSDPSGRISARPASTAPGAVTPPQSQSGGGLLPLAAIGYAGYKLGGEAFGGAAPATPQVLSLARVPAGAGGTPIITPTTTATSSSGLGATLPSLYPGGPNALGAAVGAAGLATGGYLAHKMLGSPVKSGKVASQVGHGAASGAALGAGLGSFIPGAGTVLGGAVGGVLGGIAGGLRYAFGDRLTKAEQVRQNVRTIGDKQGVFLRPSNARQSHMQLADGSYYNIESSELINPQSGERVKSQTYNTQTKQTFDVDPNQKLGVQAIAWNEPLAVAVLGEYANEENGQARIQMTGYLANGCASNANGNIERLRANSLQQIKNSGYNEETLKARLSELKNKGVITEEQYNGYIRQVDILFKGDESQYDYRTPAELEAERKPLAQEKVPLPTTAAGGGQPLPGGGYTKVAVSSAPVSGPTGEAGLTGSERAILNDAKGQVDASKAAKEATRMVEMPPSPPPQISHSVPFPYSLSMQPQVLVPQTAQPNWNFVRSSYGGW